jgi:hypothetical protein
VAFDWQRSPLEAPSDARWRAKLRRCCDPGQPGTARPIGTARSLMGSGRSPASAVVWGEYRVEAKTEACFDHVSVLSVARSIHRANNDHAANCSNASCSVMSC